MQGLALSVSIAIACVRLMIVTGFGYDRKGVEDDVSGFVTP
jgi:hypothetical protein